MEGLGFVVVCFALLTIPTESNAVTFVLDTAEEWQIHLLTIPYAKAVTFGQLFVHGYERNETYVNKEWNDLTAWIHLWYHPERLGYVFVFATSIQLYPFR